MTDEVPQQKTISVCGSRAPLECGGAGRVVFRWAICVLVLLSAWQLQGIRHYFQLQEDMGTRSDGFGYPLPNDTDRAQWAVLSDMARENGVWRVKHNPLDNAPGGADVYWSSSLVWAGRVASTIWAWWSGCTESTHTVYWGGVLIAPVLTVVGGTAVFTVAALVFGVWPAALLTLMINIGPRSEWNNGAGAWDHHGLILVVTCIFIISTYKALALRREGRHGRMWFLLSAFSTAVGFWLGVLSFAPVFASVWIGVVSGCLMSAGRGRGGWKEGFGADGIAWAVCFAVAAAIFYLLEYPDGSLHLRAEANNPTVIVSVLGAAMCLEWISRRAQQGAGGGAPNLLLIAGATMASIFPLIIIVGGEAFYSPADPEFAKFLQMVLECRPIDSGLFALYAILWVAVVLAAARMARKVVGRPELLVPLAAWIVTLTLGTLTARWWNTGTICAGIVIAAALSGAGVGRMLASPVTGLTLLWVFYGAINTYAERRGSLADVDFGSYHSAISARRAAQVISGDLRSRGEDHRGTVVLASPEQSSYLSYFLRCQTICKMSWEGLPGIRKWASAVGTKDDSVLRELCRNSRVDYVVIRPSTTRSISHMLYGRKAFVIRPHFLIHDLEEGRAPEWLETVVGGRADMEEKVYRVKKDMLESGPRRGAPAGKAGG